MVVEPTTEIHVMVEDAVREAKERGGIVKTGDVVTIITGQFVGTPGGTNTLQVHKVD